VQNLSTHAMDAADDSDIPITGQCLGMCSMSEMRVRKRERLVHPLECTSFDDEQLLHSTARQRM
jgi:hypothetical protein